MKNLYMYFQWLIIFVMVGMAGSALAESRQTGSCSPGSAALFADPLATGTLTGNVKICPAGANLAGVTVTIVAGSPPVPYSAVTNASGNYTIAGIPTGTCLPVTAALAGYQPYGPMGVTIVANQTTTLNFCMNPVPAMVAGVVTNASTGAPLVGAKVISSSIFTYTYSTGPNGAYSLPIFPAYTGTVWISRDGFDMYSIATNTYIPPLNYTMNIPMLETANSPAQPFTAVLNGAQTAVNLNWGLCNGKYMLIYDDGIEDAFSIWQTSGNMNAVKFTPPAYPATVLGCMINIGTTGDYYNCGSPITPVSFKIAVFDATGPGGLPGTQIAPYVDFVVNAGKFGWYDYPSFYGTGIPFNSSFYIVTKQVGNYPNAAGIAIDTTTNQMRSFQHAATGNGPWIPINGNFMIRAHMSGPGGPMLLGDNPDNNGTIVGYKTWRFLQGQENLGPTGWTTVGTSTGTFIADNSWPSLPCQSYRWATEAQYTGNRWSPPTFSNALGKCWTADITVVVTSSCSSSGMQNAVVTMSRHNPSTPPPLYDSIYTRVTDINGLAHFNDMYKGIYDLTISMFAYNTYLQTNLTIMSDDTIFVTLQHVKTPPIWLPGGGVDPISLHVHWNPPHYSVTVFAETWASGNFTANQWSVSGSAAANWMIAAFGNPSPSAQFNYLPQITGYDGYLTSRQLAGQHSPRLYLNYDIYLSNFNTTNINTMAVELWNGTTWSVLKTYTNSGNIPWTTEHLDLSSVTDINFRLRFHASGTDSFSINNWNIDNIGIVAEGPAGIDPCILGYNVYLNNVLSGFTPDTDYFIPCNQQVYGGTYTACVGAVYANGVSATICKNFTSQFVSAPQNLSAVAVTNSAFLNWTKPECDSGLIGYNVYQHHAANDVFLQYVAGPDSLSTYCFNLDPGLQCFHVRAKYDMSVYGLPGVYRESLNEDPGPACVEIVYGYPLPFIEPWDGGWLGYQQWTNDSNWIYNPATGNPAPSANFTWQPVRTNYNSSLTSMTIDCSAWTCATIWLDFDYKLNDRDANGTEKMTVEALWDNTWRKKFEMSNNGTIDWSSQHLDVSDAGGKGLKIRFRANGVSTAHIFNWFIDNIHVYGIGNKPIGFHSSQSQDTVNLTWDPPVCNGSAQNMCFIFDDGSEENGWAINPGYSDWLGNLFPVGSTVSGYLHSFEILWYNNGAATNQVFQIDVFNMAGALQGSSQTFTVPIPAPSTFMVVQLVNEIPFNGPFYGMIHWNNFTGATHWLGYDQNGPYVYMNLGHYYDGTAFSTMNGCSGPGNFTERACALVSGDDKEVKLGAVQSPGSTPAEIPPGVLSGSPSIPLDSHDHTTMNLVRTNDSDSSLLIGYNVYRYDAIPAGIIDFRKLNTNVINGTGYIDVLGLDTLQYGFYEYYITAVFNDSETGYFLYESPGTDTIIVQFPSVGLRSLSGGSIMIYPNPANDVVHVKSDFDISRIEVMNLTGQVVYNDIASNPKLAAINTASLQAGVYFIKVSTRKGIQTAKFTVVR
jgi:hypothetical protein